MERTLRWIEPLALALVPAVLALCAYFQAENTALLTTLAALAALLPGFQLVEEHSLTEGMAEFLPIYKMLDKIPLVRNISNRIVVLQK